MPEFRDAPGRNETSNRKQFGLLKSVYTILLLLKIQTLKCYYGAADTSIAMATGSVQAMLEWLGNRLKNEQKIRISTNSDSGIFSLPWAIIVKIGLVHIHFIAPCPTT